jgi:DNA helicase II / ATP-dependent DNA helicase PcrA
MKSESVQLAAETEEHDRLALVTGRLRHALENLDSRLSSYARDVREQKSYFWESKADMDGAEKAFTRQSIEQAIVTGEAAANQRKRIRKLLFSPYFGRFDFAQNGRARPMSIYVGVHHFTDEADRKTLIHDWRAPISTMFYDHEIGPASYEAPSGDIDGEVLLKRQFRIRDGRMIFMLETAVNIVDDVLQQELSRASEDGMKQIVATIQREQNAIIRNDHARELIIQGVAGSGKTSIALHRIAYLLYRFKDSLTSKDILIISPNRVFGDYISNVLPELGEESVSEISMETLADELLDQKFPFQTFIEQTALLLESEDAAMRRRIEVKSSPDFLATLDEYLDHIEDSCFFPEDLFVVGHQVPAGFIEAAFRRHRGVSSSARIRSVVEAIEQHVGIRVNRDLTTGDRAEVRRKVRKMYRRSSLRAAYKGMFAWMNEPALFTPAKDGKLEYADVFPLIYLRLRLEGINTEHKHIKHLLIDEMQDYTPVQYAVIATLFNCKKTILGDAKQSVNPYSSSKAEQIRSVFRQASYVKLCKSYRSTQEISRFGQRISPDPDLIAIERHGEVPQIVPCQDTSEEVQMVSRLAQEFSGSDYNTLGIICKTQNQAERLYDAISALGHEMHLLTGQSTSFVQGITICTAHMAKGLEFDHVIVPDVTDRNYHTSMDRNLLYVACTRAMHKLTLTFAGDLTKLIQR